MIQPSRLWLSLVLLLAALFSVPAAWAADVSDLTGGMSWGMSRSQVESQYRSELIAEYRRAIEGSRDAVRNDQLRRGVDDSLKRFSDTWVEFNGARTGYESSTIADEVFVGADLAMMIMASADVPKYFVFKKGKLAKIVVATNIASIGFMPFQDFIATLRGVYGRPDDVILEEDDIGIKQEVRAIWNDRKTRLRIENRSAVFNTYLMVLSDARAEDFSRDTRALNDAARTAGGSLDSIFQEVAADSSNRTGDDVVDRITGTNAQVQVRLRSDARQGDALTSQARGTSVMDDTEELKDVEKVERRSSGRRPSGSSTPSSGGSGGSGGGRTIY